MYIDECRERSRFESKGSFVLNGVTIPYNTVCEDNFFMADDGTPLGTLFSYSYFRSDVEDNSSRPVLFGYNGGPGCGSLWVHMGLFGPKRVKLDNELKLPTVPPFELEDNPHCLLDICDIVMVDPIGTGFGRLFNEAKRAEIYDTDEDIRHFAMFIDQWLTRYGRHNSPVLLAGESYGTGRSALLVNELIGGGPTKAETMGISVSGIMLLGSTFYDKVPVEKAVLDLYTMAATYQYHRPEGLPERDEFLKAAEEFSDGEYLMALHKGDAMTKEEKLSVAEKLAYFTGVSVKYIMSHNLRIDMREFMHLLLEDREEIVGFYDGRYTWPENFALKDANVIADDPAMGQYTPAFQAAFALMCKELNITFDRSSKGLSHHVNMAWNRKFKTAPAMALGLAMRRNPALRVFFASGMYDLCTTAGMSKYLAHHSNLDLNRVMRGIYPSGHMAYLGEESAQLLAKDMRKFFTEAIEGKRAW